LWINDGSTDNSEDVIRECISLVPEIDVWIETMPPKIKGNLDTIGRAYDCTLPRIKDMIEKTGIRYVGIMDLDNNPCPNYNARLLWLMQKYSKIGAAAGIPLGEVGKRRVGLPMGGGKFIRWSIVREIEKYWDIAPDTLFNIKALSLGYSVKTFRVPMKIDRLTRAFSKKGVFRQGRLSYYVGRPFWAVLLRSIRRLLLLQFGTQMLKGYFYERKRGTWRFNDPDVARFYGRGNNPITAVLEMFSFVGRHEY
jgi:glycosyltransferase involved in cell wall biosynthesis